MQRYNVRVETVDHEFQNITVVVTPDGTGKYWVIYPTETCDLETKLYDPEDFYTLKGFIRLWLLEEYEDVIWFALEDDE